ncbi:MAG: hypothetical protein R2809_09945 [Flavobacteriales bacterium]
MNAIKKALGIVWFLAGPAVLGFLIYEAMKKNALPTSTSNDMLQWGIIIGIFVPIAIGLMIFGFYSLKGEYDMND